MSSFGTIVADRLNTILDYKDITQSELATRSGLTKGAISRIQNKSRKSVEFATLKKLATALGIPECYFHYDSMLCWRWTTQLDVPLLDMLWDLQGDAKILYSVSNEFSNFLRPLKLGAILKARNVPTAYLDPVLAKKRQDIAKEVNKKRVKARDKYNYLLKVITTGHGLDVAYDLNRLDWIDQISDGINSHFGDTAMGIIENKHLPALDTLVRTKILNVPWTKINIADDMLVCVYTVSDVWFTFDPEKIAHVRNVIARDVANLIPYSYPGIDPFGRERFDTGLLRDTSELAIRCIKEKGWKERVPVRQNARKP